MGLILFTIAAWVAASTIGGLLVAKWIAAGYRRPYRRPDGTITSGSGDDDVPCVLRLRTNTQVGAMHSMSRGGDALQ